MIALPPLSKVVLTRHIRRRLTHLIIDSSEAAPSQAAIYTLSDPRDIRKVRYVGQTSSPRRRYLQHVNHARLWLPDETPWWIQKIELRPLYHWIRELHGDEYRLPVMIVTTWHENLIEARAAERAAIYDHIGQQFSLLNVESRVLDRQIPLL